MGIAPAVEDEVLAVPCERVPGSGRRHRAAANQPEQSTAPHSSWRRLGAVRSPACALTGKHRVASMCTLAASGGNELNG